MINTLTPLQVLIICRDTLIDEINPSNGKKIADQASKKLCLKPAVPKQGTLTIGIEQELYYAKPGKFELGYRFVWKKYKNLCNTVVIRL